ncbi:hypothetical protein ABKA04_005074 [Annulohypoxylon sp. FPYF3050]
MDAQKTPDDQSSDQRPAQKVDGDGDGAAKSQPWKEFFKVSETTVESNGNKDAAKTEKDEIRLLPQVDDKDLGG